jgi:hypothetical protein
MHVLLQPLPVLAACTVPPTVINSNVKKTEQPHMKKTEQPTLV